MTALAAAFLGLNLNHWKCCSVQYGSESCQSLLDWVATNCQEFREMKVVKYARYVGTIIGTEGQAHRWTAPRNNASTKSLVERLCDIKTYALSVLGFFGSISAPDEATLKAEAHALQCTTAGPYNAIHTNLLCVGSVCGLGPTHCWDPLCQPRGPISNCRLFEHAQPRP